MSRRNVREMDLIELLIDHNFMCEVTSRSMMLGILKLTSSVI